MSLSSLSSAVDAAYKRFVAEKKSPTTRPASSRDTIVKALSSELTTVRMNVAQYRNVLRHATTASEAWKKAATSGLKKMDAYIAAFEAAEKRWRAIKPGPKRASVYPMTERTDTGVDLTRSVNALFGALQAAVEKNTGHAIGFHSVRATPFRGKTPQTTPAVAFREVERQWKEYTQLKRAAPQVTRPALGTYRRTVLHNLAVVEQNLAQFRGVKTRASLKNASVHEAVKKAIQMYTTYVGHYQEASDRLAKGKSVSKAVVDGAGVAFNASVLAFMTSVLRTVTGPGNAPIAAMFLKQRKTPAPNASAVREIENLRKAVYNLRVKSLANGVDKKTLERDARAQREKVATVVAQLQRVEEALAKCDADKEEIGYFYTDLQQLVNRANNAMSILSKTGREGVNMQKRRVANILAGK